MILKDNSIFLTIHVQLVHMHPREGIWRTNASLGLVDYLQKSGTVQLKFTININILINNPTSIYRECGLGLIIVNQKGSVSEETDYNVSKSYSVTIFSFFTNMKAQYLPRCVKFNEHGFLVFEILVEIIVR